jgi:hypothetical protein
VRNRENEYDREQRIKRREPYQEWVRVEPWQLRAAQRHFATLAEFRKVVGGDLLCDRGLDISARPQQRAGNVSAQTAATREDGGS